MFQGDIEFKESENASLSVHVSAQEEEFERVKVEYNLLDGASTVDIQVVSWVYKLKGFHVLHVNHTYRNTIISGIISRPWVIHGKQRNIPLFMGALGYFCE